MCGIAGLITASPHDHSIMESMLATLSHRGPDGQGIEEKDNVLFGHRRLSIIDLACGAQPMWGSDHRALVTFNGEIFNYRELRDELEGYGVPFRTRSDTEVLVNAFEYWGEEAFHRFNGQFAFALYDTHTKNLYLCRDRLGEKPLFYHHSERGTVFASEVKAISHYLKFTGNSLEIDTSRLPLYLAFNYLPMGGSLLKGIVSLPPAHFARIHHGTLSIHRYWEAPSSPPSTIEELDSHLQRSVALRLRSDVPVGLFLSGGIDSTLIASYMSEHGPHSAFSAHFLESSFSEASQAKETCDHLGFRHHVVDIAPHHLPDLVRRLAHHGDAPLADSSALPVYLLSQATSREVTVVLAGDGGDELFGGYLTYRATEIASSLPTLLRTLISHIPTHFGRYDAKVGMREKLERFIQGCSLPPEAAHFAWNGSLRGRDLGNVLKQEISLSPFIEVAHSLGVSSPSYIELLNADLKTYLPFDILAKTDSMSMAHGLEVRAPFLDHTVVEVAGRLPEHLRRKKLVLKELLRRRCPWYSLERPKRGFSIPIHTWFRGPLRDLFEEVLHSDSLRSSALLRHEGIAQLWQEHLRGGRNVGFELWGILILILWAEEMGVSL